MVHTGVRVGGRKRLSSKGKKHRDSKVNLKTVSGTKSILWGVIAAYLLTMSGLVLCSLLLTWGILAGTQKQYVLLVMVISMLSVFAGSFIAARMSAEDGFKSGLIAGILYIVVRFLIGWLINGADLFTGNLFTEMISSLGMACLGALWGRKKKK